LPQFRVEDVKYKNGTEVMRVQNHPILTKYTLKRLSDLAKYVFGKGAKSKNKINSRIK
jgi:hypothetical protein